MKDSGPAGTASPARAGGAGTKVPRAAGLLGELPPGVSERLRARAIERSYPAGTTIFTEGSEARGLFMVLEGEVRVLRSAAGREHVIHVERAGGTLGEVPLFEGGDYPATAVAAVDTRCLVLTRDVVIAAVREDGDVALALLARMAARVRMLVERVDHRTTQPALLRLAALVLARHEAADGDAFSLGRSQQEAAEELGTVREVVVRGLRELRTRGVIEPAGSGKYSVADLGALRALAEGDA
ncbi:MAG: cyclic nucleotide-binding protein [Gemmatimonadetes bacterium]|nr:cyclic nucleotide-binding protein [Gemmatimonadota bacterium]